LGLAIASGIIKALQGNIWVESSGHDEANFPGSTFIVRLPLAK
jgi:signal transduction histidine kinase